MDKKSSYIKQELLDIVKEQWFFKGHFKNDQVIPECLELDGFWQLIGFYLSWAGGTGKWGALVVKELKFKGQVRLYHDKITYIIDIKKFITKLTFMAWVDAVLKVKDLQVDLLEKLVWGSGMDPSLDSF